MGEHARLRPCCEHEHPLSPHCWACDGVTDDEEVEPVTPEDFINANMPMTDDPMTASRALPDEAVAALREELAALEHDQWMAWSQNIATSEAISPERLSRWAAMWVPYADLTEAQKDMDREWADKVLALSRQAPDGAVTVDVEDVARRLHEEAGYVTSLDDWHWVDEYREGVRERARRLLGVGDRAGDGGGRG